MATAVRADALDSTGLNGTVIKQFVVEEKMGDGDIFWAQTQTARAFHALRAQKKRLLVTLAEIAPHDGPTLG